MKCNSCKKDLSQEMRHSIASNTCPFCGKGILSDDDYMMKGAISKILIRRGVQSDDQIVDISNDIMQLIKIDRITSSHPERSVVQDVSLVDLPQLAGTSTSIQPTGTDNSSNDAIGRAMAAFEKDTAYAGEDGDGGDENPSEEDIEVAEGVLFSTQRNDKADRLKAELAKARLAGNVAGFKSKPIKRLGAE